MIILISLVISLLGIITISSLGQIILVRMTKKKADINLSNIYIFGFLAAIIIISLETVIFYIFSDLFNNHSKLFWLLSIINLLIFVILLINYIFISKIWKLIKWKDLILIIMSIIIVTIYAKNIGKIYNNTNYNYFNISYQITNKNSIYDSNMNMLFSGNNFVIKTFLINILSIFKLFHIENFYLLKFLSISILLSICLYLSNNLLYIVISNNKYFKINTNKELNYYEWYKYFLIYVFIYFNIKQIPIAIYHNTFVLHINILLYLYIITINNRYLWILIPVNLLLLINYISFLYTIISLISLLSLIIITKYYDYIKKWSIIILLIISVLITPVIKYRLIIEFYDYLIYLSICLYLVKKFNNRTDILLTLIFGFLYNKYYHSFIFTSLKPLLYKESIDDFVNIFASWLTIYWINMFFVKLHKYTWRDISINLFMLIVSLNISVVVGNINNNFHRVSIDSFFNSWGINGNRYIQTSIQYLKEKNIEKESKIVSRNTEDYWYISKPFSDYISKVNIDTYEPINIDIPLYTYNENSIVKYKSILIDSEIYDSLKKKDKNIISKRWKYDGHVYIRHTVYRTKYYKFYK